MAGMRMAKATPQDIKELSDYLKKAEARKSKNFPYGWRRVVWGCDMLIDNCCDPNLDYLALKPELLNSDNNPNQSITTDADSSNAG